MKTKNFHYKIFFLLLFFFTFWSSFAPAPHPVTHRVLIKNMRFEPAELVVNRGDSVIFINQDLVIHNVTEENKRWNSPTIAPKTSWTYVVREKVDYYCSFHPIMRGKLILK